MPYSKNEEKIETWI